jgi:cell division protein FtsW
MQAAKPRVNNARSRSFAWAEQAQKAFQFGKPAALDMPLLLAALTLSTVGFILMSSASVEYASVKLGSPFFHVYRQVFYILLASLGGLLVYFVPTQTWNRHGWVLLFIGFLLLLLVVIPGIGREVNGSRRWLPLGPVNLQSSEVAKFCILVYIAGYLVRRHDEVRSTLSGFIKPIAVLSGAIVLLLLEPDFGAVVVMVTACLGMVFLGGAQISQFFTLIITSLVAFAIMAVSSPYRLQRLSCFVDPWAQPFDCGYQLIQSLIAFGRGGWFGVGLGNSIQKQFYLPEAHTDFVFAILAEEMGVIGAMFVIALFAFLIYRILVIARRSELKELFFNAYMCYGIALVFTGQVFINIGVNTGLLPTKGLTLPFLSYGGSSLIVCFAFLAFVQRAYGDLQAADGSNTVAARASKKRKTKKAVPRVVAPQTSAPQTSAPQTSAPQMSASSGLASTKRDGVPYDG